MQGREVSAIIGKQVECDMKSRLCIILVLLSLLTGCQISTEETWVTGTILSMQAVRKLCSAGKSHVWKTMYYITVDVDNYNTTCTIEISEAAFTEYVNKDNLSWMGVLTIYRDGDGNVCDVDISDANVSEPVHYLTTQYSDLFYEHLSEEVTGTVIANYEVQYESGSVWHYVCVVQLNDYEGLYKIYVDRSTFDDYFFSDSKAVMLTLNKYYIGDDIVDVTLDNMVYIDY